MMNFWVYENWTAENKAVIHNGACGFCNNGAGCQANPLGDRNGRWHGPFQTLPEAESAARSMNRPVKSHSCVESIADDEGHNPALLHDWRLHIVINPGVLGGKPTVKGTRLAVEFILELMAGGWSEEEILASYPNLTENSLRAVLAYAAQTFRDDRFHLLPPLAPVQ